MVNSSPALTGMVELRGMMTFINPPKVSMPRESGVTSSSRTSLKPPERISAWMAAPRATASSGILRCVQARAGGAVIIGAQTEVAARFLEFRAAKKFRHNSAHQRHAGLAADEDDLIEVFGLQFRVGQRAQAMRAGAGKDVAGQVLQFGARAACR